MHKNVSEKNTSGASKWWIFGFSFWVFFLLFSFFHLWLKRPLQTVQGRWKMEKKKHQPVEIP